MELPGTIRVIPVALSVVNSRELIFVEVLLLGTDKWVGPIPYRNGLVHSEDHKHDPGQYGTAPSQDGFVAVFAPKVEPLGRQQRYLILVLDQMSDALHGLSLIHI